ncbi:hypothetical protein [Legionella sainthelensi]|uniref:hypothetical protein n=1 Tax=Legionella sainthelensi TaxID=28087 RepID=UPI0013EE58FE|nr:hypothetical protein [Legionella sainthelensi]
MQLVKLTEAMGPAVARNGVMSLWDVMTWRITHLDDLAFILIAFMQQSLHIVTRMALTVIKQSNSIATIVC